MKCVLGLVTFCFLIQTAGLFAQPSLCTEVQAALVPQNTFGIPTGQLPRYEIRRCSPGTTDVLQVVVWGRGSAKPELVFDTNRSTIVQVVMNGDVFAMVTAGGSSNGLHIVHFQAGHPKLAIATFVKEVPRLTSTSKTVKIEYVEEERQVVHEFSTGRRY